MLLNEQCVLQAQDPVLNWATELLGIQLKETEDVLIRNMLAATAAQIDCVAGINGKVIAVVKSALIEVEAEA